ncbi:MAG TPA: heparinase II/III family protein [Candidatus Kapabacteria bacterium]|nr:heparinase II/III family protein [Candidatus Kapabacteria bacterium]
MSLSHQLRAIKNALRVQGIAGFVGVMREKRQKQERYQKMLLEVPLRRDVAVLKAWDVAAIDISAQDRESIIRKADAMLRDENEYFTFPYRLRGVPRPWNYDPYEKLHWPQDHYTEQKLHSEDTPQDVKIVWEINRFKDLPTLAQAGYLTRDAKYAEEIEYRLLSWIEDNPFANSINWASGLELGIRLLSWTTSLELLRAAGFDVSTNPKIARSIYEQAAYLRAELSTDKIVRSNHLIGEAAGLLAVAKLWELPDSKEYADVARAILESEITRQTYEDGATREATTWYHGFVTDFFDIAARVAARYGKPFSKHYTERLFAMKVFRESMMQPDGTAVRIGDADDGHALYFEGEKHLWLDALFGDANERPFRVSSFHRSGYASLREQRSAVYIRAGEFGMGGHGSSSHAHDDLLAPVLWLENLPILVDPGTFVYNGAAKYRSRYRGEHSHNTFSLDEGSEAKQKLNFGWYQVRKPAKMKVEGLKISGHYGEWPEHSRTIELRGSEATIIDEVTRPHKRGFARLHLHPMWKPDDAEGPRRSFMNASGDRLHIEIEVWKRVDIETYDYSPSYRVQVPATKVILQTGPVRGKFAVRIWVECAG